MVISDTWRRCAAVASSATGAGRPNITSTIAALTSPLWRLPPLPQPSSLHAGRSSIRYANLPPVFIINSFLLSNLRSTGQKDFNLHPRPPPRCLNQEALSINEKVHFVVREQQPIRNSPIEIDAPEKYPHNQEQRKQKRKQINKVFNNV